MGNRNEYGDMKAYIVSRRFVPTTNSLAISLFKLLSSSENYYEVFSQMSKNTWNYSVNSELISKNISSIIGDEDENIWTEEAISRGVAHIEKSDIDFFMTCVYPPYDHKIGLKIKRKFPNTFWITYWGDPVANVPNILAEIGRTYNSQEELTKVEYEREIFEKSDLIIFTNDYQKRFMLGDEFERYSDKSISIPHSYSKLLYPKYDCNHNSDGRVVISHIGHLYKIRHIFHLINALYSNKYYNKFLFKIVGQFQRSENYINKLGLRGNFQFLGELDYFESLKEMHNSDILLSVDATVDIIDHSIFMPSKISDYLGAFKPILFISYDKGVAADIARETNNTLSLNNEIDIGVTLNSIIENGIWEPDYSKYQEYDSVNVSQKFDAEIRQRLKDWNK